MPAVGILVRPKTVNNGAVEVPPRRIRAARAKLVVTALARSYSHLCTPEEVGQIRVLQRRARPNRLSPLKAR
jgi:hypothetical protein